MPDISRTFGNAVGSGGPQGGGFRVHVAAGVAPAGRGARAVRYRVGVMASGLPSTPGVSLPEGLIADPERAYRCTPAIPSRSPALIEGDSGVSIFDE
jgi:hypothetical protein